MAALTTLATLKAELGVTGSSQDTRLSGLILQVSDAIETFCDRKFHRRTLTQIVLQPNRTIYLSAWPVVSIASITDSGVAWTTDDYTLDADEGIIKRSLYGVGYGSPCGYDFWSSLSIVYTGGFILPGNEGADLPGDVERACLDLASRYFHGGGRDPALRSETIPGVLEQSWSAVDSIQTVGGLPLDVARSLTGYKRAIL
jgi:hypothetical protein